MLNEKLIAIDKGRDAGKTFKVKEMPVTKLEKWAARALLAVFGSEMPADIRTLSASSNTTALLSAGLRGLSGSGGNRPNRSMTSFSGKFTASRTPASPMTSSGLPRKTSTPMSRMWARSTACVGRLSPSVWIFCMAARA